MGVMEKVKKTPEGKKHSRTRQEQKESSNHDVEMAHSFQDSEHRKKKGKGKCIRCAEKEA